MSCYGLFAVHIADDVLTVGWQAAGFVGAGLLLLCGAWRISDDDIPRVALLTAVFFVCTLIHVPIGLVTSVHLLLNGLMGVVLGRRAAAAIPIGVFLQAVLLQHGGLGTLGVNCCVMTLPALFAWQLFVILGRTRWNRAAWFRSVLVFLSCLLWVVSLIYSITLLITNHDRSLSALSLTAANRLTLAPVALMGATMLAGIAVWAERRLENAPEFPLGLLIGEVSVLLTVLLNAGALVFGGREDWPTLVLATVVPHCVIAVIEGTVLGFTIAFLARVKPELVGWSTREKMECTVPAAP